MKQKSKVCESSEYAKSACISTVFPFGALAPDGRARGHQWHSRGQRFDPAYLHQKALKSYDFKAFLFSFFIWSDISCNDYLRVQYREKSRCKS